MKTIVKLILAIAFVFSASSINATTLSLGSPDFNKKTKGKKEITYSIDGEEYTIEEIRNMEITPEIKSQLQSQGIDLQTLQKLQFVPMSDTSVEWEQYGDKAYNVLLGPDGLEFYSKAPNLLYSTAEFPFDPENDSFEYGVSFLNYKVDKTKCVGLIYDYESNNDYKYILVGQKDFICYTVKNGKVSINHRGLVKPGKTIDTITMKREGDKIDIMVNGVDLTTLKRVKLSETKLGILVFAYNKKVICDGYYFKVLKSNADTDQSTTPESDR